MAGRNAAAALLLCVSLYGEGVAAQVTGQGNTTRTALDRAIDLEGRGQYREAAIEYRAALKELESYAVALLGMERTMHELGMLDSLLIVVDSVIRVRPADAVVRTVKMRSHATLGQWNEVRTAFNSWRTITPRDAAPYRDYARLLISSGKMQEADSVLASGESALANSRVLALEMAQVRGALGFWDAATQSWRDAVEDAEYLERAAVVALSAAPVEFRDTIRAVLTTGSASLPVRKVHAWLELGWGSPSAAWKVLSAAEPSDATVLAWHEFADRAEAVNAWLPMRDALTAILGKGGDAEVAARAAKASISGDDPQGALDIIEREGRVMQLREAALWLSVMHVRALAALGKAREAEAAATAYERHAERHIVDQLRHEVAMGWVRAGNVASARKALAAAGDAEAGEIDGWLALYGGDLKTARALLRGYGDGIRFPGTITAMSILGRTRADTAPALGMAFLALARSDSAAASTAFRAAETQLPEAASLLLAVAARLVANRDTAVSIALWREIAEKHARSPEAAEANLDWARALRARGDKNGTIERLEHLILEYPGSALLPQARRELEAVRRTIPPAALVLK